MSNLKFLFFTLFLALGNVAMAQTAQVSFTNRTNTYYVCTFHTSSISGSCPSTTLTTFYLDLPDLVLTPITSDVLDENGNIVSSVADVTGLTIKEWPSGNSYVIEFCAGGIYEPSSSENIPVASSFTLLPFTIVGWNVNTGTNEITLNIL